MDGRFRHHALATRHYFPHSGEDYGSVNKTHEDTMIGGSTFAHRQARRAKRGWKKFTHFLEDAHDDDAEEKAMEATEAAMLVGAGKKNMFQELGSSHFWKRLPHSAGCKYGVGKMRPKHCSPSNLGK